VKNFKPKHWDQEADILVVGSGAAGSSAALNAFEKGASVIMIEKRNRYGGTTEKSGGVFWIPNNTFLRAKGVADKREDALRYMARLAYPTLYNPDDPNFGLNKSQFDLIAAYYDNATKAIETLQAVKALDPTPWISWDGQFMPDYYAHIEENKVPRGRALVPRDPTTGKGVTKGFELIRQLRTAVEARGIPVFLNHRAHKLITNDNGKIIGLEVLNENSELVYFRAKKAVIFGSGGFTHNPEFRLNYLRGPVFGGCAVPTNQGDIIPIASEVGAKLVNLANAWWAQVVFEEVLTTPSPATDIFLVPGDSMIEVNKYGNRVMDEKAVYNERTQMHFVWDPLKGEFPNLFLFMIYDDRAAKIWGAFPPGAGYPFPRTGEENPYVIKGNTLEELTQAIEARLTQLSPHTGNYHLDTYFLTNLKESIARFNKYAEKGVDEEFHRGEVPIDLAYNGPPVKDHDKPNITMYPISQNGPYYAIIIAGGTLDTKGGPKINIRAQILNRYDEPIPGLYGAGNCIGSPAGQAYWAGGGTIGPALTFGYIAANNAVLEPEKPE